MPRVSKNEATRIRHVLRIFLNDLADVKHGQDFVRGNAAQRLRFHLSAGVIGKTTAPKTSADRIIVHAIIALPNAQHTASAQLQETHRSGCLAKKHLRLGSLITEHLSGFTKFVTLIPDKQTTE